MSGEIGGMSAEREPTVSAGERRAFVARDPDFERRVRDSFARQGFLTHCGATIDAVAPGHVDLSVGRAASLTQQHGFFHGGLIATLADTAAGYAALSLMRADAGVLSVEFKLNFIAPARGERLVARGHVLRPGRTLTVCRADVEAVDGDRVTEVATALLTMMCVDGFHD
jgi:uncharacterized protein (TIGR00369 family)